MFLMSGCNTFIIIVYKSFFDGIPTSLIEAAKIDGAGDLRVFAKIVFIKAYQQGNAIVNVSQLRGLLKKGKQKSFVKG